MLSLSLSFAHHYASLSYCSLPLSHSSPLSVASPRLASLRLCVSSFSANWYYGSALSSETEMQVGFTRVFTRDAHLHSRCSRSPVSATRVMRCRAYTRACAYTYTGIDTDAVMHREGGGRKRRISTETREKGDGERGRGQIDERIEGGKEGSEGCKGI